MGILRQRLAEGDPELSASLERSWAIAGREWLPAVRPSLGSFNSGPHLENMERHLDRLVVGFGEIPSCRIRLNLRPAELYLLLAGVLFHDLGRTEGNGEHGLAGEQILLEQYAHLGIPSKELARVLGLFCLYHNPPKDKAERSRVDPSRFGDVVIDPYGPIRCRSLAALLRLVDQMDSAYTRALPPYLKVREGQGVIGLFRSAVRGVHIDQYARMVRTVVSDELPSAPWAWRRTAGTGTRKRDRLPFKCQYEPKEGWAPEQVETDVEGAFPTPRQGLPPLPEIVHGEAGEVGNGWGENLTWKCGLTLKDWAVGRGLAEVQEVQEDEKECALPPETLLAVILGDVRRNGELLREIRSELAAIGMPLAAWRIDYREHLYDEWGRETYEPVFTYERLKEIARGMWELSLQVFGTYHFTYNDLASQIGEPDVRCVKMGARRLAILTRDLHPSGGEESPDVQSLPPLWAGDMEWRWNVHGRDPAKPASRCAYVTLGQVSQTIPTGGV